MSSEKRVPKSIILTLLQNDDLIPTCYIQETNLAQKFIESLKTLIANENAVDEIVASNEIVNLFSMLDNNNSFAGANVDIKEIESNIFAVADIRGSTAANSDWPIVFTEAEYRLMQNQPAAVFDASDKFLNNSITNLDICNCSERIHEDHGFMCTLARMNRLPVLRTLLDRNVDVEQSINEPTAFQVACIYDKEEVVAMFVYYNVAPRLPAVQHNGVTYHRHPPVYYAAKTKMDEDTIEMLIDYTFDKWSDFDVDFLLQLMFNGSPNLDKVARMLRKHADTMTFFASHSLVDEIWTSLFTVRACHLKQVLAFFRMYRHGVDLLLEGFSSERWLSYWMGRTIRNAMERKIFFENLYCLGDAFCEEADEPKPTILQMMMDKVPLPLRVVTGNCQAMTLQPVEVEPIVLLLLANNAPMDSYSFEYLFRFAVEKPETGVFDACRYLEVDDSAELTDSRGPFVSSFFHRFVRGRKTITEVLRDPANLYDRDMPFYVRMSSHPAIKDRAANLIDRMPSMSKALEGLPKFQTLLELARDAARDYVIEKYKVKTAIQLQVALKKLDIPEYLKKIIEYNIRTPLYNGGHERAVIFTFKP